MRKEIFELIEAVRNLGLVLTGKPAPKCVISRHQSNVFVEKLEALQIALEAADKSGAISAEIEEPQPKDNPERLRLALDGLMRLYQLKGGNLDEAADIIQQALGVTSEQKDSRKTYDTLPNFAPDRIMRKRKRKYRLDIVPKTNEAMSFDKLRKMHFEVMDSQNLLGDTVAHLRAFNEPIPGSSRMKI